jgi:NAD(P)-dependent dehydrogenase (short-subunit alcohol dehydrogenase family)
VPVSALFDLIGKVALVTGTSRGPGQYMGRVLASAGADRVITSRSLAHLEPFRAASGDINTALRAIREARSNLELLGRLDGTLLPGSQATQGDVRIRVEYVDRPPLALQAPGAIDVTPEEDEDE